LNLPVLGCFEQVSILV